MLLAGRQERSIGSCLDRTSILSTFRSQLSDAVNLPAIQANLASFQLNRAAGDEDAVFDFRNLGQTLANMSDAIQWAENKPYADLALEKVQTDSSIIFHSLADMILSINFQEVALSLNRAGYDTASEPEGIDGEHALELLNALSNSVDTTRLGAAIQRLYGHVSLQALGMDLDAVKGNLKLEQLVGVLANLPNAVDFFRVGQLLSNMAGSFNFSDVGLVMDNLVGSAGRNLEFCNFG